MKDRCLLFLSILISLNVSVIHAAKYLTPPEVWKGYDSDWGDFKEEVVCQDTKDGTFSKESYISANVNGKEVRVFCKYAVKEGARKSPGLLNVHGWMGGPAIDMKYVNAGWAVMAHDYSGIYTQSDYTKYPDALAHIYMVAKKWGMH